MSATVQITIWCDGKHPDGSRCGVWHMADVDSKAEARREAAWLAGFTRRGLQDLCRTHSENGSEDA